MPKPLSRVQQLENAAFLRHLRRIGNVCAAAKALGFGRGRFIERRAKHPAFALQWDAALVLAHAALGQPRDDGAPSAQPSAEPFAKPSAMPPGEPRLVRSRTGRLQLRKAQAGKIDHAGRQRFLAALSATANVRLSAAAAGYTACALYRHRHSNSAFAREWRLALKIGYERLEMAMLESGLPESFVDDDWRRNDPPAMPPMTVNQALQLMYLHQKEARLGGEHPQLKRPRPGETSEARLIRLALMYEHRQQREREQFRIAEAERLARGEPTRIDWEAEGNPLPDLSQVTGWSKAKGQPATGAKRALFGGWRLGDIPDGKRKG